MENSMKSSESDETCDALFGGQLKLFQSRAGYRFSLDALLLADFVTLKARDKFADLGTGSGVVPLILARREKSISILAVECQDTLAERAQRNVMLNHVVSKIKIVRGDVRQIGTIAQTESFDGVVCNPPYRKPGSGRLSPNDEKQIARHEINGALPDFLRAAALLLRGKGRIALVYGAGRVIDLLAAMRQLKLEPKRLRMVHSFAGAEASLILVEGVKDGRSGIKILPPLIIFRHGKEYSEEVVKLIAGEF
jgi:tRNA1Val (adenine37-N6)-methyltransferase